MTTPGMPEYTADEELYATNLYGGTDADIDNTEKYTSSVDLTSRREASVDIIFTGSGSTDNITLALYKRRDDNFDGSEEPIAKVTVTNAGSEKLYHFPIILEWGKGFYRYGMVSTGATDTFDVNVEARY